MTDLKYLMLNNNSIRAIPMFSGLTALRKLVISSNEVDTELDAKTFSMCKSLRRISAREFTASNVDSFAVSLELPCNLEYLHIGYSRVTSIHVTCAAGPDNCSVKTFIWNNSPITCRYNYVLYSSHFPSPYSFLSVGVVLIWCYLILFTAVSYDDFKNTLVSFTLISLAQIFPSTPFGFNMPELKQLTICASTGTIPGDLAATNPHMEVFSIQRLSPKMDDAFLSYVSLFTHLKELNLA